jgi:hypothetical protein
MALRLEKHSYRLDEVAASLHHVPMKAYIQNILEGHVRDLEMKAISLGLPKGKS